jgi:hypothetical protein
MHQLAIHNGNWVRTIARVIAGLWAGFWMFFGIASGIGERLTLVGVLMHVLLPGVIFVGIAAFAWRWQLHGSIVLMLSGIIVMIAYPLLVKARFTLSTIFFVLLTMAIPPLVSGALLFFDARKNENRFHFKTED